MNSTLPLFHAQHVPRRWLVAAAVLVFLLLATTAAAAIPNLAQVPAALPAAERDAFAAQRAALAAERDALQSRVAAHNQKKAEKGSAEEAALLAEGRVIRQAMEVHAEKSAKFNAAVAAAVAHLKRKQPSPRTNASRIKVLCRVGVSVPRRSRDTGESFRKTRFAGKTTEPEPQIAQILTGRGPDPGL